VAAFPGPDLDESCSLQLADHLGPGHLAIVNLPLGFVNASTWQSGSMGSIPICGCGCDRPQVLDGVAPVRVVTLTFASWNRVAELLRRIDGLRQVA